MSWLSAWPGSLDIRKQDCCFILIEDRRTKVDGSLALLRDASVTISMSRTGNCYDNAVTASFFGTLKVECSEGLTFQSRSQARQAIFEYTECYYNRVRRHSTLGYKSPVIYEQLMC